MLKTLGKVKITAGISVMALMLAACSQSPAPAEGNNGTAVKQNDGQIELTFVNWGTVEAATKAGYEAMIKGFEDKHPNIKIKSIGVPFNQMLDQLLVMNAGGSPPDVSVLHGTWTSTMYEAGALEPLDNLLSEDIKKDFYQNIIQNVTYDGKLVAAPWTPAPSVIYYNKELLKKAGISKPPATLAELREQAAAIAKQGKDESGNTIYGMGIQSKRLFNAGFYYLPYIWEQGGDLTDADGNVTLDTPEVVKALTETRKLFDNEVTPAGLEIKDLRSLFSQGRLGFHIDIDAYGILLDLSPKKEKFAEDFGMVRIPEAFFLEYALGVSPKSEHKEAAAQFVEYLSSSEGMAIYNANGGNRSPARDSVAEIEFYKKPENAHMQFYIDAIQQARPLPVRHPGFVKAMEEVAEAVQRVGINKEDPANVVKDLQKKVAKIYGK
ncbi:ABC transporter substrate-binding protein [Paenibacillus sp. GCM10027626]|uniref:ABC transporter substrate-binding protein n=1 Tax=Paenibacillus sp. GCM10027626 TaxID=3273411 RepID=UPI00363C75BB